MAEPRETEFREAESRGLNPAGPKYYFTVYFSTLNLPGAGHTSKEAQLASDSDFRRLQQSHVAPVTVHESRQLRSCTTERSTNTQADNSGEASILCRDHAKEDNHGVSNNVQGGDSVKEYRNEKRERTQIDNSSVSFLCEETLLKNAPVIKTIAI